MLSRRQLISDIPLAFDRVAASGSSPVTAAPEVPERVRGADLSFTLQLEATGYKFNDQGRTAPVEQLLAARGTNTVRLRVWVNPPAGYSDLASALTLGRRAHDVGCKILLDLHYSDFWADRLNQTIPLAWQSQELATLASTVRSYARDAVVAFAAQGTPLDVIQIGNEVTCGMLWPTGSSTPASGAVGRVRGAAEGRAGGCPRSSDRPAADDGSHRLWRGQPRLTLLLRQHHGTRC